MAYKVGGTTVIDNSGNVKWSAVEKGITLAPKADNWTYVNSPGHFYSDTYDGYRFNADNTYQNMRTRTYSNCNCNCNCRC